MICYIMSLRVDAIAHSRDGHVYVCMYYSLVVGLSVISRFAGSIPWCSYLCCFSSFINPLPNSTLLFEHAVCFVLPFPLLDSFSTSLYSTLISFHRICKWCVVCRVAGEVSCACLSSHPDPTIMTILSLPPLTLDRSNLYPLTTWIIFLSYAF